MELYNETHKVIKAIRKRFNIYHEIPCTADDRRVQEIISIVVQTIEALPSADVVPKSAVEKWYSEYHAIKDKLAREKMEHKATDKLADKYCAELQTAKDEIERLEAYNENLRTANAHVLGTLQDEIEKAKTESIKEFAKMLKEEMQNIARVEIGDKIYFLVGEPLIDDIEKQMLEEV